MVNDRIDQANTNEKVSEPSVFLSLSFFLSFWYVILGAMVFELFVASFLLFLFFPLLDCFLPSLQLFTFHLL